MVGGCGTSCPRPETTETNQHQTFCLADAVANDLGFASKVRASAYRKGGPHVDTA
jgi:hypothetical protein